MTGERGDMKTAKELVEQINAAGICAPHEVEDMDNTDGVTEVTTLDQDEHRWYVLGTVVFKAGDEFFGVRGPVSLKSESMGWDDVGVKCEAFEMESVPSVTYKRKKANKGMGGGTSTPCRVEDQPAAKGGEMG